MINLNECSAIYAGGKFGEITEFYVKPEFRSQDIGASLISRAKDFARESLGSFGSRRTRRASMSKNS